MDYLDLLQKLYSLNLQRGIKFGLDNMLQLSAAYAQPEKKYPVIHIAGTNGKGSVAAKIAKAYETAGRKVGLYTSPHISTYRERIRINGTLITEEEVVPLLNDVFSRAESLNIPATFFELTTLTAFKFFAEKSVDLAVVETGLGGRLDATNIVTPILSVITSISLEHTEILGHSLEEIAREKGGIIKKGIPVVLGPTVPLDPIQSIADRLGSHCMQVSGNYSWFDEENNAIARRALQELNMDPEFIEAGLKTRPACRLEIREGFPNVILDVGHNPDGLHHLFLAIKQKFPHQGLRIVCGLSRSKDIQACFRLIAQNAKHLHLIESNNSRAASTKELASVLEALKLPFEEVRPTIAATIQEAIDQAARHNEIVVVCGTFFIMAEVRKILGIKDPLDPLTVFN